MTQGEAIATHGTNKTQGKHQTLTQQQTGHHRGEGPGQPWRDVTVGESISPTPTAPGRECAGQRQLGWGPWPWGAGVGPRITPGVMISWCLKRPLREPDVFAWGNRSRRL